MASKGDFEKLVEQYSPFVLATAMRILSDQQQAVDVHQDIFLSIWSRWHTFNGKTNWPGYLYRASIRKAIQNAKKRRLNSLDDFEMQQSGSRQSPDSRMKASELKKKLIELISKLPKRQAEAFIMSRLEGLDYCRIAEIMGCTVQTVRVHLHRAVKRLADGLADY